VTNGADILIGDLIEIPERIHKGDFVINLAEGITRPEETLRDYVITDQLADAFDRALDFIRSAIDARSSKAAYLHGSFGSGKSHFMAVLHLLLQGNVEARSRVELATAWTKHRWVEGKKFLLVPYHMIGARGLASAILGGYVDHVTRRHPEARHPGVYRTEGIFENAAQLREDMGDEKFFAKLKPQAAGGWGALAKGWTPETFEAAMKAPPGNADRVRLVGDLVGKIFPAYKGVAHGKEEALVDLDEGLSIISRHAQELGYSALILFLDELILWLATHAGNLEFIQREGSALTKLVESQRADRPAPIVSFVARQKDLRDFVGEKLAGADKLNFADILKHWEDRFGEIKLEDRNLPAIIEKRILRPKHTAAGERLRAAFEETAQVRKEVLETLLTKEADRKTFLQVFPFSPALVQALVAVSSALQRERTAIRILLELLVEKRDSLRLGEVVPVGDLWDVVSRGDNAFNDSMRKVHRNADRLYREKLRPLLETEHGVSPNGKANGGAGGDPKAAEKIRAFRNDDRLLKTLLLAALCPEVETLKNLTAHRLAALNHGTIRSPIPGREGTIVLQKVKTWASQVGQIRLGGDPQNPTVSIQLSDVDTESIIETAKIYDTQGQRQIKVREMVFEALGLPGTEYQVLDRRFQWRGTERTCDLLFSNVRDLNDEALRMKGDGWKVVIDFPFDAENRNPNEDVERLRRFPSTGEGERTFVWLPCFFSNRTQVDLGKLITIENLLKGSNLEQFTQNLSATDRTAARTDLQNQHTALKNHISLALEEAYGMRPAREGTLDTTYDLSDERFTCLKRGCTLRPPVAANFRGALDHLLGQALSFQFPQHPEFGRPAKLNADLRKVLEAALAAAGAESPRAFVDKPFRPVLLHIANPLELGKMTESHFVLETKWKEHFNRMGAQEKMTRPSVADLRRWMDLPEPRGLPEAVQNLLILVYAAQTNRTFFLHGRRAEVSLDSLPDELELREEELPPADEWSAAGKRGAEIFGVPLPPALNASSLKRFVDGIAAVIGPQQEAAMRLPGVLHVAMENVGVPAKTSARFRTASAVKDLLEKLEGLEPAAFVGRLAGAKVETSGSAMGASFKAAAEVNRVLQVVKWEAFKLVEKLRDEREGQAKVILEGVRKGLTTDEYVLSLASTLPSLERSAFDLLTMPPPPPPPPPPGWKQVASDRKEKLDARGFKAQVDELSRKLGEGRRIDLDWTIWEKESK